MRFASIIASIVCLGTFAFALPSPDTTDDMCCCCDPGRNVIGCTRTIPKADCFCLAVVCPANAPTVMDDDVPSARAVSMPASSAPTKPAKVDEEVKEPARRFVTKTKPAPAPTTQPQKGGCSKNTSETPRPFACCCCNAGIQKMVCEMRAEPDCICAQVMCPANAETIFVQPPTCTSA